eukprot:m.26146 g.26146  ORF g.26146 m.26146 type:complete len:238 (+) comp4246_c0_seq1:1256-1969(+)
MAQDSLTALETRLRGEEETFLRLKESIMGQNTTQIELAYAARLVCNEETDEVMQTLMSLARRLTAIRREATCLKDIQNINTLDAELSQATTQHGRSRQMRDKAVQEFHVATTLEKEVMDKYNKLELSIAYALRVLAQEKVKKADGASVRSDVITLQASLLDEISHLVNDLGELCVRRSHALTLASRGLGATKGISGLQSKVGVLEHSHIGACEHEDCLSDLSIRRRHGVPSSAIVST